MNVDLETLIAGADHCSASNAHCTDCPMEEVCKTVSENIVDMLIEAVNILRAELNAHQVALASAKEMLHAAIDDLMAAEISSDEAIEFLNKKLSKFLDAKLYRKIIEKVEAVTAWENEEEWFPRMKHAEYYAEYLKGGANNDQA